MFSRLFLIVLFGFFLSSSGQATTLPVAQWLPVDFLGKLLDQQQWKGHWEESEVHFPIDLWELKASKIAIDYEVPKTQSLLTPQTIELQGQKIFLMAKVFDLSIDQTVERVINGHRFQVRIQAHCDPFEIQLSSLNLRANFNIRPSGSELLLQFRELLLNLPQDHWSLTPIVCRGPSGALDSYFSQTLTTYLNDQNQLAAVLFPWVKSLIEEFWLTQWRKIIVRPWQTSSTIGSSGSEPHFKFLAAHVVASPLGGFFIYGNLFDGVKPDLPVAPIDIPAAISLDSQQPQLIVNDSDFRSLMIKQLQKHFGVPVDLSQNSSFRALLGSRLKQLFLWRDLWKFSKNASFLIEWPTPINIELGNRNTDLQGSLEWDLKLFAKGLLKGERNGQITPYVNLDIGAEGQLGAQFVEGSLKFSYKENRHKIDWQFNEEYQKKYRPKGSIAKKVIEGFGTELAKPRDFVVELPEIELHEQKWRLTQGERRDSLLMFKWGKP